MANPFYIPQQNPGLDIASLALNLYGLKQRGDIAGREAKYREDALAQNAQQHSDLLTENMQNRELRGQEIAVGQQRNRIAENQLSPREKSFGTGDLVVMKNRWRASGFDPDKMTEYFSLLEPMAKDPNVTRGQYAEQLVAGWDQGVREALTTSMAESIDAILKKNPNADVSKQVEILNKIEATPQDKAMETLFPDIVQYDQAEEAKLKQPDPRYVAASEIAMKVANGEMDEKTGEVLTAMLYGRQLKKKEPMIVPPGSSVIDPENPGVSLFEAPPIPKAPPRPTVVPPGATVLGEDGQPTYTAPSNRPPERPTVVPPGGTVFKDGEAVYTAPNKPTEEKGPTATEVRQTAKDVADAETKIRMNSGNEALSGEVDLFNQYADKPYAYEWKKGTIYGGTWEKINLPKNNKGTQITARDIYAYAALKGMTYSEVLKLILEAAAAKKK